MARGCTSCHGYTKRAVCIYDQIYGSLRLTSHLMKTEVLHNVFARSWEIALHDPNFALNAETRSALEEVTYCISLDPEEISGTGGSTLLGEQWVEIILPGSVGINVQKDNEEFEVEGVFFSPQFSRLAYRGKHLSEKKKVETTTWRHSATTMAVPVELVRPLEGESKTGFYNLQTGEIVDHLPEEGEC